MFLILLTALSSPAHADYCYASLTATLPADGAVDVPINARIAVEFMAYEGWEPTFRAGGCTTAGRTPAAWWAWLGVLLIARRSDSERYAP